MAPVREEDREAARQVKESFRVKNAYAILIWQESLPKPNINTKELESELTEAIGEMAFYALRALAESEQEHLRFSAERLYGPDRSPRQDFRHLTRVLMRERLSQELAEVTGALRQAENQGNTAESEKLLDRSKLLTGRIAQLLKIE